MTTSETLTTTGMTFPARCRYQFEDWPETGFGAAIDAPDFLPTGLLFASVDGRALVAIVRREDAYQ